MRRLGVIAVLGGLSAFGPMSVDLYLPAFPLLQRHFDATQPQVQLTLTACLAGLAAGQLCAGPISDAAGRRRPLLAGLAGYAGASALCSVAPTIYALAGLRFLQGLGGAAGLVISRAVVRDRYQGVAVARIFSMLMLVTGLAPMLAPVLGAQVLRLAAGAGEAGPDGTSGWRVVFAVLAGYGLLLMLGVLVALPESLPAGRRHRGGLPATARGIARLAADRGFLGYALCGALSFAAMFGYISASSFVFQDVYRISAQWFAVIFGANALGLVLAGQLNAALVGRVATPRRLLSIGLGTNLVGGLGVLAVVGSTTTGLYWLLVPLFLMVASIGVVTPNTTALALAGHPEAAGSAAALLGMLQMALGAAVAPLVGLAGVSALPMAVVIASLSVAANVAYRLLGSGPPGTAGTPAGCRISPGRNARSRAAARRSRARW